MTLFAEFWKWVSLSPVWWVYFWDIAGVLRPTKWLQSEKEGSSCRMVSADDEAQQVAVLFAYQMPVIVLSVFCVYWLTYSSKQRYETDVLFFFILWMRSLRRKGNWLRNTLLMSIRASLHFWLYSCRMITKKSGYHHLSHPSGLFLLLALLDHLAKNLKIGK